MTEVKGHETRVGFVYHAKSPIEITRLPRTKEGSFVSKLGFLNGIYPSTNPKVAEGGPVGHKTRLSPLLARLQRGDKDGASVVGGIVGRGEGVQRALLPRFASSAPACRGLQSLFLRLRTGRREGRG